MLAAVPSGITTILLELGAILLGLAVLARLAFRVGISPIPLFLLTGLLFGVGGVIPVVTAEDFIEIGAEIGVILLLFTLGLEYSARTMVEGLRRNALAGLIDGVFNAVPGVLAGLLLGWGWVPSLFLGAITYISSSGIVSRMLEERSWSRAPEGRFATSLLVIEDLSMAIVLPVLAVLATGSTGIVGALQILLAVGVAAALFSVSLRFGPAISRLVFSHADQALLLAVLGVTLLTAGLAERFQVSAEVGAFLAGVMVSGPTARRARYLTAPLRELFSALFFLFFGFGIDPATIPGVLGAAVVLALVTAGAKVATGVVGGRRLGLEAPRAWRAGVVLIPRGEFSIAIAGIAVVAGLEPRLAPLTATYVLLLAVAAPLIVAMLPNGRASVDSVAEEDG